MQSTLFVNKQYSGRSSRIISGFELLELFQPTETEVTEFCDLFFYLNP